MFERPNQHPNFPCQPIGSWKGRQKGRESLFERAAGGAAVLLPAGVRCGSRAAMEDQLLGDDALLWQLRESRRRFQRHMQRLIEKVRHPPPTHTHRPAGVGGIGARGRRGKTGLGAGVRMEAAERGANGKGGKGKGDGGGEEEAGLGRGDWGAGMEREVVGGREGGTLGWKRVLADFRGGGEREGAWGGGFFQTSIPLAPPPPGAGPPRGPRT